MAHEIYKYKFYTNIMHAIGYDENGNYQNVHRHTIDVIIYIEAYNNRIFLENRLVEEDINEFLESFEGKVMNDIKPFDTIPPTIENMGEDLFKKIEKLVEERGYKLLQLEISELPTRSFVVRGTSN